MIRVLLLRFSSLRCLAWPTGCLLTATLSSLLSSCTSDDPIKGTTLVEGQVLDRLSRQPVPDALVQVYQPSRAGGYSALGTPYPADASGHFSFRFEAKTEDGFLLRASARPGYLTDWGQAPHLTSGRKNKGLVIPVVAPAWVRLQLVDVPPKTRGSLHLSGYEGNGERIDYPQDTILIRPVFAGFARQVIWVLTESGVDRQYAQNIQPMALDTVAVRVAF